VVTTEPQLGDVASLAEPATVAGRPTAARNCATATRRLRPRRRALVRMDDASAIDPSVTCRDGLAKFKY
jgi:hypothetical protein